MYICFDTKITKIIQNEFIQNTNDTKNYKAM